MRAAPTLSAAAFLNPRPHPQQRSHPRHLSLARFARQPHQAAHRPRRPHSSRSLAPCVPHFDCRRNPGPPSLSHLQAVPLPPSQTTTPRPSLVTPSRLSAEPIERIGQQQQSHLSSSAVPPECDLFAERASSISHRLQPAEPATFTTLRCIYLIGVKHADGNGPEWRARDAQVRMHLTLCHCCRHLQFRLLLFKSLLYWPLKLCYHLSCNFPLMRFYMFPLSSLIHKCSTLGTLLYFVVKDRRQHLLGVAVDLRRAR